MSKAASIPKPSPQGGMEQTESVAPLRPASAGSASAPALAPRNTGLSAGLRHARYILSENAVTGFYLIDSLIAGEGGVFIASLKQLVLPALTLGIFALAPIARMTRASMLAVLASDFVRTARASGASEKIAMAEAGSASWRRLPQNASPLPVSALSIR